MPLRSPVVLKGWLSLSPLSPSFSFVLFLLLLRPPGGRLYAGRDGGETEPGVLYINSRVLQICFLAGASLGLLAPLLALQGLQRSMRGAKRVENWASTGGYGAIFAHYAHRPSGPTRFRIASSASTTYLSRRRPSAGLRRAQAARSKPGHDIFSAGAELRRLAQVSISSTSSKAM